MCGTYELASRECVDDNIGVGFVSECATIFVGTVCENRSECVD